MNYHILIQVSDARGTYYQSVPPNVLYTDVETLKQAAVAYANAHPNDKLVLVQEIARVAVEPVVTMVTPTEPVQTPPKVYRAVHDAPGFPGREPVEDEPLGPPREPKAKPRLLVLRNRAPTLEELQGYLMVFAQGKVVKNAFGSDDIADMPLSTEELLEVKRAMGPEGT